MDLLYTTGKALEEFTIFSRLPKELQNEIWAHATEVPRVVKMIPETPPPCNNRVKKAKRPRRAVSGIPNVLQVCHEARKEALRHYVPFAIPRVDVESTSDPPCVYINPFVDILNLDGADICGLPRTGAANGRRLSYGLRLIVEYRWRWIADFGIQNGEKLSLVRRLGVDVNIVWAFEERTKMEQETGSTRKDFHPMLLSQLTGLREVIVRVGKAEFACRKSSTRDMSEEDGAVMVTPFKADRKMALSEMNAIMLRGFARIKEEKPDWNIPKLRWLISKAGS